MIKSQSHNHYKSHYNRMIKTGHKDLLEFLRYTRLQVVCRILIEHSSKFLKAKIRFCLCSCKTLVFPFLTIALQVIFSLFSIFTSVSPLPLFFYTSILKGQAFPAVTLALHLYSVLNLAKSQAAVYASSNQTAIWHEVHQQQK